MMALKAHRALFQYLVVARPPVAVAIIKNLSLDEIDVIGMIFANVLAGVIRIGPASKSSLSLHADVIRKIAKKELKSSTRRLIILKNYQAVLDLIKSVFKQLYPDGNGKSFST